MGSVNSHVSEPKKLPYSMSKFAIKAFADGLYWEMKPLDVAVTLISPGLVKSELRQVGKNGQYYPDAKDIAPKHLVLDTKTAAQQIISAIRRRKKNKFITFHGSLAIHLSRYAPILLTPLLKQKKASVKAIQT